MGEYEFYDYMAIDRPLTADERKAVSALSPRTEASAVSSENTGIKRKNVVS